MENHFSVKQLVKIAVLAAISYVLMMVAIPIIPVAPYMKLDLSDLSILIGTVTMGFGVGMSIVTLKALIYWILMGGASMPSLVGVFSSWMASVILLSVIYFGLTKLSHYKFIAKWSIIIILATLALTIIMSLLNLFIITPLYVNMMGLKLSFSIPKLVLIAVIPFNLIKGISIGIIFAFIYKSLKALK